MFNLGSSLMNRYKQIAGISVATVILLLIFVPIQNKQSLSTVGSPSPYEVQGVSPQLQSQAADNALKSRRCVTPGLGRRLNRLFWPRQLKDFPSLDNRSSCSSAGPPLVLPRTKQPRQQHRNSGYGSRCSLRQRVAAQSSAARISSDNWRINRAGFCPQRRQLPLQEVLRGRSSSRSRTAGGAAGSFRSSSCFRSWVHQSAAAAPATGAASAARSRSFCIRGRGQQLRRQAASEQGQ